MSGYDDIISRLCDAARASDDVHGVILFGSRARSERPADDYSDYDLLMLVDDPAPYLHGDGWPESIGSVGISFLENGHDERRVFFDGARDVDMIFVRYDGARCVTDVPIFRAFLSRGYRVLVDKHGLSEALAEAGPFIASGDAQTEADFTNDAQEFFFHILWAAKKALRGETWSAVQCVNGHLKELLLRAMELEARGRKDTWHDGRFVDAWMGEDVRARLGNCFAAYDKADVLRAVAVSLDLYAEAARRAADVNGWSYPALAEKSARAGLTELTGHTYA